jgi:hypothetical protein
MVPEGKSGKKRDWDRDSCCGKPIYKIFRTSNRDYICGDYVLAT